MFCTYYVSGQETGYGPDYQTIIINNPAFAGSEGDGILKLSYMNLYPGNGYNLHSVIFSYDAFIPSIHGGAGIFVTDDYLGGIVNDMRGGISYSYHLQTGKRTYINGGLTASFYHRGYNFGKAVLPDQIDSYGNISLPAGEILDREGRTVFDIGTGFLVMAEGFFAAVSVNHLAEPYLESSGTIDSRIKRKYQVSMAGDIPAGRQKKMAIRPVIFFEKQGGYTSLGSGGVLENNLLSVSGIVIMQNGKKIDFQTGFTVRTGMVTMFYNYRFNISSVSSILPFSLLHQTGLAIRLQGVEKRNVIKTINYPKM
jgi:type IX secretion system PorP/SprF family membrane protein